MSLALLLILTVSNIALLHLELYVSGPQPGAMIIPFILAAIVRLLGLFFLPVALLRVATRSARQRFSPDAGFWFYVLFWVLGFTITGIVRISHPGDDGFWLLFGADALARLVKAPAAAWVVALVVVSPLATNPKPWISGCRSWLLPLISWQIVLVSPIAALHVLTNRWLGWHDIGSNFWSFAVLDGFLTTLVVLLPLALSVTAYRSVAQD